MAGFFRQVRAQAVCSEQFPPAGRKCGKITTNSPGVFHFGCPLGGKCIRIWTVADYGDGVFKNLNFFVDVIYRHSLFLNLMLALTILCYAKHRYCFSFHWLDLKVSNAKNLCGKPQSVPLFAKYRVETNFVEIRYVAVSKDHYHVLSTKFLFTRLAEKTLKWHTRK